jgi:hypothetical protein
MDEHENSAFVSWRKSFDQSPWRDQSLGSLTETETETPAGLAVLVLSSIYHLSV